MLGEVDPRVLWEAGGWGWAILASFGASSGLALGAVFFVFFASAESQGPRRLGWLSASAFLVGIFVSVAFAHPLGRSILLAIESADFHNVWEEATERLESSYLSVGLSLGLNSLLAAVGISAWAIRERKASPKPAWFVPFACALLCLTASAGILMRASLARNPDRGAALAVWDVVWVVEKSARIVPNAKALVVGLALVSSFLVVLGLLRRKEQNPPPSKARLAQSSLVGLLGLSAWLGSRPLAQDGEHPLPFPRNAFGNYHCPTLTQLEPQTLPRMEGAGKRCMDLFSEDIIPLALIELSDKGPAANGKPLKSPEDAFDYINTQRLLRDAGNPPGHWSVIYIAAPASMPAEELGPWLGAAANPNQRVGVVLLHDQPPLQSATRGTIARRARCSCPRVVLDEKGASLHGYRWGEVASLAAKSEEDMPLVLDPGYWTHFDGHRVTLVKRSPNR